MDTCCICCVSRQMTKSCYIYILKTVKQKCRLPQSCSIPEKSHLQPRKFHHLLLNPETHINITFIINSKTYLLHHSIAVLLNYNNNTKVILNYCYIITIHQSRTKLLIHYNNYNTPKWSMNAVAKPLSQTKGFVNWHGANPVGWEEWTRL